MDFVSFPFSHNEDSYRDDALHELHVVAPKHLNVRLHQPQVVHHLVHIDGCELCNGRDSGS